MSEVEVIVDDSVESRVGSRAQRKATRSSSTSRARSIEKTNTALLLLPSLLLLFIAICRLATTTLVFERRG